MGPLLALLLTFAFAPAARASVTAEEAAVSERLSGQANEFLVSLLGSGRAKAVVTVSGEQTQTSSQSDFATPGPKEQPARPPTELPGYNKDLEKKAREQSLDFAKKSHESSSRESGLVIKQVRVSVVLDARLTQEQVTEVTNLLPKFLHLDVTRGDEITVLRADLKLDNWKTVTAGYLLSKEGIGTVTILAGVLVLICMAGILFHLTANSAIRTFVWELAAHRASPFGGAAGGPGAGPGSPELIAGGMPSLSLEDEDGAAAQAGPTALLGHRFDFLTTLPPAEFAKLIANEPPADLALLFATLAASHPDLSATVFASLEPALRATVSHALAAMTAAEPERLEALEARLKNLVDFGVRGPERLGEILSRLPAEERDSLVRDVVTSNPKVQQELERAMFSFEDILQLKEADFRRLILAVPYATWGLALRGAPDPVVGRVLAELNPGTQGMLQEAMSQPQPRTKILEARSKVVSQTLHMAAKGEITLQRDESTELI
jgi:flagellar motor switch protein FliG